MQIADGENIPGRRNSKCKGLQSETAWQEIW